MKKINHNECRDSNQGLALGKAVMGGAKNSKISRDENVLDYVKPALTAYGDVRDITFGPSPGGFESGSVTMCDRTNPGSCPF